MDSHGAALELSAIGAVVLVGGDSQPARADELWRGGAICLYHLDSQRRARRFDSLCRLALVSGLRADDGLVGADADGRSTARRLDYVDTRRPGLHLRRADAVRRLAAPL